MAAESQTISLTFPDGSARSYDTGVTPAKVAAGISTSLAKKAISATVSMTRIDCTSRFAMKVNIRSHHGNCDMRSGPSAR